MSGPQRIASRANPLLVTLRRLARDGAAYRRLHRVWLEGDHLAAALLARGGRPSLAVLEEAAWDDPRWRALAAAAERVVLLPAELFASISALESPARGGFVIDLPPVPPVDPAAASVVLDRVQDPGNVGSILRSAAAFGVGQVLALAGTVALWSPKVLRAAMGAHFGLRLVEGLDACALGGLAVPLVATSSHADHALGAVALPSPCAWVFGHEGQGVEPALAARCALVLRIPQPGGEESLNVAAAAAVCLYESARRGGQ
ncbi:MAG: RNA methyltransferase [Rubrivivax sp.]|jgi:TrmH family RNA methyltransferase|nr:RNA methyltransferase [Rubrivivax sp.]